MAIKTTPLTDTQIKSLKATNKDKKYFDGGGLFLLVKSTGVKFWRFKYKKPISNKETLLSFGKYPEVSLQQARKQRDEARELIKQGIDPQEHKAELEQRKQDEITSTFKKVATDWFKVKSSKGLTEITLKGIWNSLELHIFPHIGNSSIFKLKAKDFIKVMEPLRANGKLETIKRLCQRINEIMFYAVNIGLIEANPVVKIKDAFESPTKGQMPTIKAQELPEFMQALAMARIELQTRCLIEWQLLTMTRPNEAVGVKWQEIDFNNCLWIIPAEKMKMRREHTITLNKQAMALLSIMKPISGHREHIFPSLKPPFSTPMNSQTANMAIKRMGYKNKLVAHGLRALASTILNEQGFDPNVIEAALAHVDSNSVRRAYNRATYLEQRKIMLDWWGDFVEQASKGNVSLSGSRNLKLVNH